MGILEHDLYPRHGVPNVYECIGREENNNIRIKLYRAYTIEFLTQFNELFSFFFCV